MSPPAPPRRIESWLGHGYFALRITCRQRRNFKYYLETAVLTPSQIRVPFSDQACGIADAEFGTPFEVRLQLQPQPHSHIIRAKLDHVSRHARADICASDSAVASEHPAKAGFQVTRFNSLAYSRGKCQKRWRRQRRCSALLCRPSLSCLFTEAEGEEKLEEDGLGTVGDLRTRMPLAFN